MIDIDISLLEERYLLANTAVQIYKSFRENRALYDLAKEENKNELIEEFKRRTDKEERKIDDVVVAYAILVIATFYEYSEGREIFRKLDMSKLKWGRELEDIYGREARATIYTTGYGKGIVSDFLDAKSETSN